MLATSDGTVTWVDLLHAGRQYELVVCNPPYMGSTKMPPGLAAALCSAGFGTRRPCTTRVAAAATAERRVAVADTDVHADDDSNGAVAAMRQGHAGGAARVEEAWSLNLYMCFMQRCVALATSGGGLVSCLTMRSWLASGSFQSVRTQRQALDFQMHVDSAGRAMAV